MIATGQILGGQQPTTEVFDALGNRVRTLPFTSSGFAAGLAAGTSEAVNHRVTVDAGNAAAIRAVVPLDYQSSPSQNQSNTSRADRLYSVLAINQPGSQPDETGFTLTINELNTIDQPGSQHPIVLRQIVTDIEVHPFMAAAFDGDQILITEGFTDRLLEVETSGALVGEVALPESFRQASLVGPVVLEGITYVVAVTNNNQILTVRYDSQRNAFFDERAINATDPETGFPLGLGGARAAASTSINGDAIWIYNDSFGIIEFDPVAGEVTGVRTAPIGNVSGAEVVDGNLWAQSFGSTQINVLAESVDLDDTLESVDNLDGPLTQGLAGGADRDNAVTVSLDAGTTAIEVSHGFRSILGSVSGTIVLDANANSEADPDDFAREGVTVFIDGNSNGLLDAGELSTQTDELGNYTLDGVRSGGHAVSVIDPIDPESPTIQTFAVGSQSNRMFVVEVVRGETGQPIGNFINEIDPQTGQQLRQFEAPGDATFDAGLAVDESSIYYSNADGVHQLDIDSGQAISLTALPTPRHDGLAIVGEQVYVLRGETNVLLQLDPVSQSVVNTLDLNAINATGDIPIFEQLQSLGESPDGSQLIAQTNSRRLYFIDPITGQATQAIDNVPLTRNGLSGLGGLTYGTFQWNVRVIDLTGSPTGSPDPFVLATLPVGHYVHAVGAAAGRGTTQMVTVLPGQAITGADFLSEVTEVPNSAPELLSLSGPTLDEPGRADTPITLSGLFVDVDLDDTHIVTVDWGDGNTTTLVGDEIDQAGDVFAADHVYGEAGFYEVSVTVDDGTDSVSGSTEIVIAGASLKADGTLLVIGTPDNDSVRLIYSANRVGEEIRVRTEFGEEDRLNGSRDDDWAFGSEDEDNLRSHRFEVFDELTR